MLTDLLASLIGRFGPSAQEAPPDSAPATQPLDALGETAETATEAATELASWISSGQREALLAIAITVATVAILIGVRMGLNRFLARFRRRDDFTLIAILQRVNARFRLYFMITIGLWVAHTFIQFPESVEAIVKIICILGVTLQFAEWVQEAAISSIKRSVGRSEGDSTTLASAVNIVKWVVNVAIWSVALLLILSNLNINVAPLVAGLGIGGLAIGLAAQGIFRDLFSALSIIMDKPFMRGDVIRYDDTWGTIEDIGLKTTRIRSKSGEQIIISNTNLLETEIHNTTRMTRRRIEIGFGVIYQTEPETAEKIPGMVAAMVKEMPSVEFDRCSMSAFGASSLDYELVVYSLNPDFNRSMAAKSKVLLALFRMFTEEGIEFAYPTQTLFIEGADVEEAVKLEAVTTALRKVE